MFKLMGAYTFNKSLINDNGLEFIKLFGTGSRDGFSLIPDFSSYVIITSWKNDHFRKKFINKNSIINEIISRSSSRIEIKIDPYSFTGSWNGINPFKNDSSYNGCLLYTSPSPRDRLLSRMPSSA